MYVVLSQFLVFEFGSNSRKNDERRNKKYKNKNVTRRIVWMQPKQPLRQAIAKEFLLPGKLIISLLRNKSKSSKSTVNRSKRKTLAKIFGNLNRIKNKNWWNEWIWIGKVVGKIEYERKRTVKKKQPNEVYSKFND